MKKLYCITCSNYRKFKKLNIIPLRKIFLSIICSKYENEDEKFFKEEELIEISKIIGLIENM